MLEQQKMPQTQNQDHSPGEVLEHLEIIASFSQLLQSELAGKAERNELFGHALSSIERLTKFEFAGFAVFDEHFQDCSVDVCTPLNRKAELKAELETLIDNKTFARALQETRPVLVPSRQPGGLVVIAPLAIRDTVFGMFLGVTCDRSLGDVGLKTLSILLLSFAATLENIGLLQKLNKHSENLKQTLKKRTLLLSQAKRELEEMNAQLNLAAEKTKLAAMEAKRADQFKRTFLANMSHEIRTPTNGVIGMTEMLLATDLDPVQADYVNIVKNSADSLLVIINDILDLSKMENNQLTLEKVPFDLYDLVEQASYLLSHKASQKGLELAFFIAADVPEKLEGDPVRLRQVLLNLMANAVKFTDKGTVDLHVTVANQTEDEVVLECAVRDTGIGISEEMIDNLFDPFVQGDVSTTRKYGGTGLGLAISKKLVGMMGGQISVSSEQGKGSHFLFTIKLSKQQTNESGRANTEQTRANADRLVGEMGPGCRSAAKILIAERNETVRRYLSILLESRGFDCQLACNHTETVRLLREADSGNSFDLLLLNQDMVHPIRREIGEEGSPIIALCRTPKTARQLAKSNAVCDAISKPPRRAQLYESVKNALAEISLRAESSETRPAAVQEMNHPQAVGKILVAEDNPVNRQVAQKMLEKLGYTVSVVSNGAEAVKALQTEAGEISLVFMDCQMPDIDGYQATRMIRAMRADEQIRKIPIVAMTAHVMQGERDKCLKAGMSDYLEKPLSSQKMGQILKKWLAAKGNPSISKDTVPPLGEQNPANDDEVFAKSDLLERALNDETIVRDILESFFADFPLQLKDLEDALELADTERFRNRAHTIKGAAGNIGAPAIYQTAALAEKMATSENLIAAADLVDALSGQFEQFQRAVTESDIWHRTER